MEPYRRAVRGNEVMGRRARLHAGGLREEGQEAVISAIRPFGTGSLLASRCALLWHTPWVLRLGIAQSLLAERLRRRSRFLMCPCAAYQVRADEVQTQRRPIEIPAPDPVDRYWPSDRDDEGLCVRVDSASAKGIELIVGTILDLWT